jgi:CBS domain-containing protein
MATIRQLLDKKGHAVLSVRPDETVYDAIRKMADKNVGSLVVIDGDKLVGIMTERHYARNVFLKGRASPTTSVRDIPRYNGAERRLCAA